MSCSYGKNYAMCMPSGHLDAKDPSFLYPKQTALRYVVHSLYQTMLGNSTWLSDILILQHIACLPMAFGRSWIKVALVNWSGTQPMYSLFHWFLMHCCFKPIIKTMVAYVSGCWSAKSIFSSIVSIFCVPLALNYTAFIYTTVETLRSMFFHHLMQRFQ